ncbi:MAG: helix-turn-helix domain-containing protein [Alphaproteobacteria bacterium]
MELTDAATRLSALSQETRLGVFRLLMVEGPDGMAAGEIARRLAVPPSTLSTHLSVLVNAGLVTSTRIQRSIRYAVDITGARDLIGFLTDDCCRGNPEICGPSFGTATSDCALPAPHHRIGPEERVMADENKIRNVLFLCTGNSARSIIAEAILNRDGVGRFMAWSAGSMPTGEVNPHALALLRKLNHPTEGMRSKSWDEFAGPDAPVMDFVFTVCDNAADEVCPFWPGLPMTAHWGVPDPAAIVGTEAEKAAAFAETYRMMTNRISTFVNLPLPSLDKLGLQKRLDEIGRGLPESA